MTTTKKCRDKNPELARSSELGSKVEEQRRKTLPSNRLRRALHLDVVLSPSLSLLSSPCHVPSSLLVFSLAVSSPRRVDGKRERERERRR